MPGLSTHSQGDHRSGLAGAARRPAATGEWHPRRCHPPPAPQAVDGGLSKAQKKRLKKKAKAAAGDDAQDGEASGDASAGGDAAANGDATANADAPRVDGEAGETSSSKKKKKKKAAGGIDGPANGGGAKGKPTGQTTPPTVPVSALFPGGVYPEGEWQSYAEDQVWRETSAETRERERLEADMINGVRRAAEVHRQVRAYVRTIAKPGIAMTDLCEKLEGAVRTLIEENGMEAGIAFPTGCSLNHVAAHWTPNAGDNTVLQADDVMKLGEFGWICVAEPQVVGLHVQCASTPAAERPCQPPLPAPLTPPHS